MTLTVILKATAPAAVTALIMDPSSFAEFTLAENRLESMRVLLLDIANTFLAEIARGVVFAPGAVAVAAAGLPLAKTLTVEFKAFRVSAITAFLAGFLFVGGVSGV